MARLNSFINQNFGMILLTSAFVGLVIPSININSSLIIILSLAVVILSSYFQISFDSDLLKTDWKSIFYYYSVRFLILPVASFFLFRTISPFYSVSFFLLLLLPAAVSSPAFTAMYDGKVTLALKILIFSSFASIVFIPFLSGLVLTQSVQIDSKQMFLILVYTLVIPFLVHLPLRKSAAAGSFFKNNKPLITAIGLATIFIFSTSKNKQIILSQPQKVIIYAGISLVFYLALYLIGFYINYKNTKGNRIAFSVSSGANNIGMGVTLTMLFFPGDINVFFIISQLAWIFVLIPMRYFYKFIKK